MKVGDCSMLLSGQNTMDHALDILPQRVQALELLLKDCHAVFEPMCVVRGAHALAAPAMGRCLTLPTELDSGGPGVPDNAVSSPRGGAGEVSESCCAQRRGRLALRRKALIIFLRNLQDSIFSIIFIF